MPFYDVVHGTTAVFEPVVESVAEVGIKNEPEPLLHSPPLRVVDPPTTPELPSFFLPAIEPLPQLESPMCNLCPTPNVFECLVCFGAGVVLGAVITKVLIASVSEDDVCSWE